MKKKSILCIVAHPDDEALGPGGALINHSSNGDDVFIIIFLMEKDLKMNTIRVLTDWKRQEIGVK